MKNEYKVIVIRTRNYAPEEEVNEKLSSEYAGWEVVSATSYCTPQFIGQDGFPHVDFVTTVVVRRKVK